MTKRTQPPDRADTIALHYTGDDAGEPHLSGVPARDLTEHDLSRLAFVRDADPAAVRAELIASGFYTEED